MTIQVIPTTYRGITYRSRLEARWALFFSEMRWRADYEPNGYVVEGRPYLPDFFIHEADCFAEIKPFEPSAEESLKIRALGEATKKIAVILIGAPSLQWPLSKILNSAGDYRPSLCRRAIDAALTERFDGSLRKPQLIGSSERTRKDRATWRKGPYR